MARAGVNQVRRVLVSKIHLRTRPHRLLLILIPLILLTLLLIPVTPLTMMMTLKIVVMTENRIKANSVKRKEHFTAVTLLVHEVHQTQRVQVERLETSLIDWWQELSVN